MVDKLKNYLIFIFILILWGVPFISLGEVLSPDSNNDGLTDEKESNLYHTNPYLADSDNDGYKDGDEIKSGYDPLDKRAKKLEKKIEIILNRQILKFYLGKPASHGCVRLGVGPAKLLYDWTEIGTKVIIKEKEN